MARGVVRSNHHPNHERRTTLYPIKALRPAPPNPPIMNTPEAAYMLSFDDPED